MTINTYPVKMRERGQVTIPQSVREQWAAQKGDMMTLVQFEDFILISPTVLRTPALARQFSQMMDEEDISLADLLEGLAEERRSSGNGNILDEV